MVEANKPVGALCIAPAIIACILKNVEVTIGNDSDTANNIDRTGAKHIATTHGEVIKDSKLKIFSTPCYMLDASISQIALGAENIVSAMIKAM